MDAKFVALVRKNMDRINQSGFGFSIISDDYSDRIFDLIQDEVAEDIYTAAGKRFTDDDVRLAVGRVLTKCLRIEF
jgi:hypothetical protein